MDLFPQLLGLVSTLASFSTSFVHVPSLHLGAASASCSSAAAEPMAAMTLLMVMSLVAKRRKK